MNIEDKFTKRIIQAGGNLKVKSALNPALWMCAIISIPTIAITSLLDSEPPIWLITIMVTPVMAAVAGFLFLLFFDRDKLQSEDFQLRKQSLELIQEKGQEFAITDTSIDLISNPDKPKLSIDTEIEK